MEATRSGLPLLAASARPRAGVLLAGCAILVAVLGVVFAHRNTADAFDHAVDSPVITVSLAIPSWPSGSPPPARRARPWWSAWLSPSLA